MIFSVLRYRYCSWKEETSWTIHWMNLKHLDWKQVFFFPWRMATPYVPVPIPVGNSSSSFTNRNQRRSSFGSISTSSSSSKGQPEDSTVGSFKKMSMPDQTGSTSSACSSPLVRTKFTGLDTSIEYCTQPIEEIEQNTDSRSWEDRPSTPTILGYEVMEERAKFTVSFWNLIVCSVMIRYWLWFAFSFTS